MDNLSEDIARNLSHNLLNLRKLMGISQALLAKKALVPRSTLTYMESGLGNPTLNNVAKVAQALNITIGELISSPIEEFRLIKKEDIKVKTLSHGEVIIQKLLPDPIPGMEIDHIKIQPKGRMKGSPHIKNTKEYLFCSQGSITVFINKRSYKLEQGDLFRFPGDRAHAYVNESSRKIAIGFSVVAFN